MPEVPGVVQGVRNRSKVISVTDHQ